MMTRKYGEPTSCTETFNSYVQPTTESERMYLLRQDRYKYETYYKVDGGTIYLRINHIVLDYSHYFEVSLSYYDAINIELSNQNAIDDL